MAFRFFQVPARDSTAFEEELNRFLRGHRVLSVDRRWVDSGENSFWVFCVDYLEKSSAPPSSGSSGSGFAKGRVDYREVLNPVQFSEYMRIRNLRQSISKEEAAPAYVIFTNDQLATMVRNGAATKADLRQIDGVGENRIEKYGDRFLECIRNHRETVGEAVRPPDGSNPGS